MKKKNIQKLEKLAELQNQIIRITRKIYKRDIQLFKEIFALLLKIVDTAKTKWGGNREDKFLDSYLILTNKIISDLQGCYLLWERGLYGTAFAIVAVMLRSQRMLAALHFKPSLAERYLNEERNDFFLDKNFQKIFSERNLQKIIDAQFGENGRTDLEKSLHGSAWGSRKYYGKIYRDEKGLKSAELTFAPFFEPEKSAGIIKIIQASCLDIVGIYLEKYQRDKNVITYEEEYKRLLRETTGCSQIKP